MMWRFVSISKSGMLRPPRARQTIRHDSLLRQLSAPGRIAMMTAEHHGTLTCGEGFLCRRIATRSIPPGFEPSSGAGACAAPRRLRRGRGGTARCCSSWRVLVPALVLPEAAPFVRRPSSAGRWSGPRPARRETTWTGAVVEVGWPPLRRHGVDAELLCLRAMLRLEIATPPRALRRPGRRGRCALLAEPLAASAPAMSRSAARRCR